MKYFIDTHDRSKGSFPAQELTEEEFFAQFKSLEEAAERFLLLSGGVVVLMGLGFLRGSPGTAGRMVASAAALALVLAGYQVGHSGGRVVFGDSTHPGISALGAARGGDGLESGTSDERKEEDD